MPPESPFPRVVPRPERPENRMTERQLLESTWRRIGRVESMLASHTPTSIPPMRAPMQTHPGIGADSSSGFAAPTEQVVERVLDTRELKEARDRKAMIKTIIIAAFGAASGVGMENLAKVIFGHHP